MTPAPRVSIGLPVYNEQAFVARALDSLLAQRFTDFELIISDNASTDGTYAICAAYAARDPRIRLHRNADDLGALENFRIVLRHARGRYFMWAAADDWWDPRFIDALARELDAHPEAGVAMSAIRRVLESGEDLDEIRFVGRDNPNDLSPHALMRRLTASRKHNLFIYGLYRTAFLQEAMRVFPDVLGGDRVFVCQLALATRFRYVDDVLHIRTHRVEHERRDRDAVRRRGPAIEQVGAMIRVIIGSPVIPLWRKLAVGMPTVCRYALFVLGRAYGSERVWTMISRFLLGEPLLGSAGQGALRLLTVAIVVLGAAVIAASYLTGVSAWVLLTAVALCALAARLAWTARRRAIYLLQESQALQKGVRALLEEAKAIRYGIGQVQMASAESFDRIGDPRREVERLQNELESLHRAVIDTSHHVDTGAGEIVRVQNELESLHRAVMDTSHHVDTGAGEIARVQNELESLRLAVMDTSHYVDTEAGEIARVRREMRYLTDFVIGNGREPAAQADNPLARYARDRHRKHTQVVAYARLAHESRIRALYLGEMFPEIERVAVPIGAINELTGHPNKVDLLYVCAIARHRQARRLFEFGTYQGRTTYHLTFATDGAEVWTLNLPADADPRYAPYLGTYYRGTDRERYIVPIHQDSREFDTTPHRGRFDFIFVDGDHGYDGVGNDTAKAFEMLAPGGAIVWHDYGPKSPELVRFFRDFTRERALFRIKRTCLLLHLDGVDPLTFAPHPLPPSLELASLDTDLELVDDLYHG